MIVKHRIDVSTSVIDTSRNATRWILNIFSDFFCCPVPKMIRTHERITYNSSNNITFEIIEMKTTIYGRRRSLNRKPASTNILKLDRWYLVRTHDQLCFPSHCKSLHYWKFSFFFSNRAKFWWFSYLMKQISHSTGFQSLFQIDRSFLCFFSTFQRSS